MSRPNPQPDGRAARLLTATLRPEARSLAGILAVLGVAMALRLALPVLLGHFADEALGGATTSTLTTLATAYVAAALGSAALDLVVVWWSARVSWRAGNRLRERLATHALRLEQAWHGRHSPGQLIERIDGDVEAMAIFFGGMAVQIAGNVALILGMLVVATAIDVWTGLVLTVTAVAGAAVMVRLRMAAVGAREHEREVNAQLYGDLEERLGGLEDIRANGAGGYAVHRLHHHSARSWRAARKASLRGDGAYAASAIVFAVGTAATLVAGIVLQQRGVITIGAVLTLYRYADMLRRPLETIAEQLKEFQKAMAGARRASTLLATEPVVADGPDDGSDLPAGALAVDLDDVTFTYAPDDPEATPALRGIDLHLPAGTHLGLVGRTGSGKTTVGRLLARIWDVPPGSGAVRVGGADIRTLTVDALRSPGRRGHPGRRAVPDVGARQRHALRQPRGDRRRGARRPRRGRPGALARRPPRRPRHAARPAATACPRARASCWRSPAPSSPTRRWSSSTRRRAGSTRTPRAASPQATERLLAGRTAVIIAHRLDTLDRVDEIAVLDRGRLVEHGPRGALAADPTSRYARLRRAAAHGRPRCGGVRVRRATARGTARTARSARGSRSMTRVALRLARNEPVAYAATWIGWVTFFSLPLLTGLLVKVALDRVADGSTSGVWALVAGVVGIEAVRWTWLVLIAVQWHGCWVGWQTVPRVNLLRSLVDDPGPAAGPAAGRAGRGGEPLPRRRGGRRHGAGRVARPVGRGGVGHRGAGGADLDRLLRGAGRRRPGGHRHRRDVVARAAPARVAARGPRGDRPGHRVHRRHVRRGPGRAVGRRRGGGAPAVRPAQRPAGAGRPARPGRAPSSSARSATARARWPPVWPSSSWRRPSGAATCRWATSACSSPTRR